MIRPVVPACDFTPDIHNRDDRYVSEYQWPPYSKSP
jgi:hypothetical protein